jgi:multiple sugar transport system permease protein
MLLLVGGLQGIPVDVNEAAAIDGAGFLRKFCSITLPHMRRPSTLVLVFATVGSFLAFEQWSFYS